MTAPSIAGTTTADVQDAFAGSAAATSVAVSLPTAHTAGDLLVLTWDGKGTGTVTISTTGTAWTQKFTGTVTAATQAEVWYVRDGGSEPSSVTVNWTVAGRATVKVVRITGAITSGDPFDVFSGWGTASTTNAPTAPTTICSQADTLLLSMVVSNSGLPGTVGAPSGMRELGAEVISNASSGGQAHDLADETRASAGATGTRAWALGNSVNSSAISFAIAPAASTATTYVRRHGPNYRR